MLKSSKSIEKIKKCFPFIEIMDFSKKRTEIPDKLTKKLRENILIKYKPDIDIEYFRERINNRVFLAHCGMTYDSIIVCVDKLEALVRELDHENTTNGIIIS